MTVMAEVELIAVEGPKLRFICVCRHECEVISEGHHERFIIDMPRFMSRLEKKAVGTP